MKIATRRLPCGHGANNRAIDVAKKDRANIDDDELADFKKLARAFSRMTDAELRAVLNHGDLLELCDEE